MEPKKYIKKAEQERRRQRGIAQSYLNAKPSLGNLYNAARAFWNSLPFVGISAALMNPYVTMGDAPTGGKIKSGLRILSPSQIKTLTPRDRKAYTDAIDRITYRDAFRRKIDSDPQYIEDYDKLQAENAARYADRNSMDTWEYDNGEFDPELEWLEYKYGGTDTYDILYKNMMRRRVSPKKNQLIDIDRATEHDATNAWLLQQYKLQNDPGYQLYIHGEGGIPYSIRRQGDFMDNEWFWYKDAGTDTGVWRINNYNRALRGLPPTVF